MYSWISEQELEWDLLFFLKPPTQFKVPEFDFVAF